MQMAFRCPACETVITTDYDPENPVVLGDYFCRTHNETLHRALIDEQSVEEAFNIVPPEEETPGEDATESGEEPAGGETSTESPSEAPVTDAEVSPVE